MVKGRKKQPKTDNGSEVKTNEAAVIWSPKNGYRILLPWGEDEEMPIQALALIACAMRLTEEESFNVEMYKWYENKIKNNEESLEN